MASSCPVVIDRAGTGGHAEAAGIRATGPVSQVARPGHPTPPPVGV
jgi:hypothetical protein